MSNIIPCNCINMCPICKRIVDVEQVLPRECALLGLTAPFRNVKGIAEYAKTGWCQGCQDNVYGKED